MQLREESRRRSTVTSLLTDTMKIDLKQDLKKVEQDLATRVKNYGKSKKGILGKPGDPIRLITLGYSYDQSGFENIGIFYGAEIVREWRGDAPVNVFGRVDPTQYDLLREIGDRVWRQGGEPISIRLLED